MRSPILVLVIAASSSRRQSDPWPPNQSRAEPSHVATADEVRRLAEPSAYAPPPAARRRRRRHICRNVFLAGERVYKMKKPVRFAFLDFSTLARARGRLPRGAAPQPTSRAGRLSRCRSADARGCGRGVAARRGRRRRLARRDAAPAGRADARSAASPTDTLDARRIEALAATLARFLCERRALHDDARTIMSRASFASRRKIDGSIAMARAFAARPSQPAHLALLDRLESALSRLRRRRSETRVRAGRIVDGHGDLRPEHICFSDPIAIFDCLEFNRRIATGRSVRRARLSRCRMRAARRAEIGPQAIVAPWRVGSAMRRRPRCSRSMAPAARCCARVSRSLIFSIAHPRQPEKWEPLAAPLSAARRRAPHGDRLRAASAAISRASPRAHSARARR